MRKTKKTLCLEKLEESSGIVKYACDAVGISRKTYYDWCKKDSKFKEKAEEIKEGTIDRVEGKLLSKINEGDTGAIIFYLKTIGKSRGYVERVEQNISINPFEELMKQATATEVAKEK